MAKPVTTTYKAEVSRDETGAWCAGVEALHAYTDGATFAELRASLAEAVNASLDDAGEEFAVELYVKVDDLQAAAMELGDAS